MQKIEMEHVYKSFKGNMVLRDISLHCESGHIYGIVGHNGSGKTVLFKCICGFYQCTQGSIRINGKTMGKETNILSNAEIVIDATKTTKNICVPYWKKWGSTRYKEKPSGNIRLECANAMP